MKKIGKLLVSIVLISVFFVGCEKEADLEQQNMKIPEVEPIDGPEKDVKFVNYSVENTTDKTFKSTAVMRINSDSPDDFEDDDNFNSYRPIYPSQPYQERNFYDDPYDYIILMAEPGIEYLIETKVYGYADTYLKLYDINGNLITSNDDGGVGLASKIEWGSPDRAPYIILCKSYNNNIGSNRAYKIIVEAKDFYEEDDSRTNAKYLPFMSAYHNFYDDAYDNFYFVAPKTKQVRFETYIVDGSYADTELSLWSSPNATTPLMYNDDKASGDLGSKILYNVVQGSTYYVTIKSYSNRTGANRMYYINYDVN